MVKKLLYAMGEAQKKKKKKKKKKENYMYVAWIDLFWLPGIYGC